MGFSGILAAVSVLFVLFSGPARAQSALETALIEPCPPSRQTPDFGSQIKNIEQVHDYLVTHFGLEPPSEYQRYIKGAAKAFELPETFLTCLFVREAGGKWNPRAISRAGAVGLSQLMPDPIQDIHSILQLRLTPSQNLDEAPLSRADIKDQLRARWQRYWDDAVKRRAPRAFGREEAMKPVSAIGAGTLWAKYYQGILRSEGPTQASELDLLVMTSGAYNLGVNTFLRVCGRDSAAQCTERMRRRSPETYHHMVTMRRCMEEGNFDSMELELGKRKRP